MALKFYYINIKFLILSILSNSSDLLIISCQKPKCPFSCLYGGVGGGTAPLRKIQADNSNPSENDKIYILDTFVS